VTRPRRFALLGHPVSHSVSPLMHRAAYAALGLPHDYLALDVPDESALARALADTTFSGFNVTVPWKRHALALAASAAPSAAAVQAANVLTRGDHGLTASNTDVGAIVVEVERLAPRARRALVIGGGGAALAAVAALGERGIATQVTARSFVPGGAHRGVEALQRLGATPLDWSAPCGDVDVVVQATSAGMRGASDGEEVSARVDFARLSPNAVAWDLVYNPPVTPFLAAARAAGLRAEHGLGMLVAQAELAFAGWLGLAAPPGVMYRAAASALGLPSEDSP
jgi:shikimate dehydrogenase